MPSSKMPRLRQYLTDKGLTQAEFGKQLGVSQPTIWEWIEGHSKPSADRLIELSRITGVSIDELLADRPAKKVAADRHQTA